MICTARPEIKLHVVGMQAAEAGELKMQHMHCPLGVAIYGAIRSNSELERIYGP